MKHLIFPVSLWTFSCLRRVNFLEMMFTVMFPFGDQSDSLSAKQTFNTFKKRNKNVLNAIQLDFLLVN